MLLIVVTGFAFLISFACGFDKYNEVCKQTEQKYKDLYDVDITLTRQEAEEEYGTTSEKYRNYLTAYDSALGDDEYRNARWMTDFNLPVVIVSLSLFLGYFVTEFWVPFFLKNGQTVGKKVFGIGVMYIQGVRLGAKGLFVRTMLGKYTVETMVPLLGYVMIVLGGAAGNHNLVFIGLIVIAAIILSEVITFIVNKNRCLLHDLMSATVVVDLHTQMLFDSMQQLIDYKAELNAEAVNNTHD